MPLYIKTVCDANIRPNKKNCFWALSAKRVAL